MAVNLPRIERSFKIKLNECSSMGYIVSTAKYRRQEVIQKATELFWSKGFHATSMRNIQQAIDLRPGSIYSSFGSKERLFKEALEHYAASSKARLKASVENASSPLNGLKNFVTDAVIGCPKSVPSSMCMLVKTISELTEENQDLLDHAKGLLKEMEATFAEVLVQAQKQGEIDGERSPERMARYIGLQLMGLRTYARANEGDDQMSSLIDDVFDSLK